MSFRVVWHLILGFSPHTDSDVCAVMVRLQSTFPRCMKTSHLGLSYLCWTCVATITHLPCVHSSLLLLHHPSSSVPRGYINCRNINMSCSTSSNLNPYRILCTTIGVDGIKSEHLRHEWLLYVVYPPSSRLVSIVLNTM